MHPTAPWSYPTLCLCWRIGLGGVWLARPRPPRPRTLILLAARRTDLGAGPVDAAHAAPVAALLRRSALAALAPEEARERLAALTAEALIRPERLPGRRGLAACSPFLAGTLAGLLPGRRRLWVPAPQPVWDPATWRLVDVLQERWEDDGITFVGRDRHWLFRVAGTRRMARQFGWPRRRALACGRAAARLWRHWFETHERPRLDRLRDLELPAALRHVLGDGIIVYRRVRGALRRQRPLELVTLIPPTLATQLAADARASIAELLAPVRAEAPRPDLRPLTAALAASPLGLAAAERVPARTLSRAASATAAGVLRLLTAPWPWRPRPVIRGPRRARLEARRRALASP